MTTPPVIPQPCDILCTRGTGWLSRMIRCCTRVIGESRTMVNHVGLVVTGGPDAQIVEALSTVQRHSLAEQYAPSTGQQIALFRPRTLSAEERRRIVARAESYVGRSYGYVKIAAHALDWLLFGAYVFRRLTNMDRYPICSWVVAHAYAEAGKTFGVPAGAATPDDIWDFCTTHPDLYELVHPLGPLTL